MFTPSNDYLLACHPERPHRLWWVHDDEQATVKEMMCWQVVDSPNGWYVPDLGATLWVSRHLFGTRDEAVHAAKNALWQRIEWCRARLLELDRA